MTPHQRWTQTDITGLRARSQLGEDAAAIAAALGRPVADVLAMMGRLRLRTS